MEEMMNDLIDRAKKLEKVNQNTIAEIIIQKDKLVSLLNEYISNHPDLNQLIGNNKISYMNDNHRNHINFMISVLDVAEYELLPKTIPWVYRTYYNHGFSYDYFPIELNFWKKVYSEILKTFEIKELIQIYDWMIANHENMIKLSQVDISPMNLNEKWEKTKTEFLENLLNNNRLKCRKIADDIIKENNSIEELYQFVIKPAMYEVGLLWEKNIISVAREHLCSAIVSRVMANVAMNYYTGKQRKGKAIITASPDEFHEIGAWMIADVLEQDGWDILYLGANTPTDDILKVVNDFNPDFIGISVTMSFNISEVRKIISKLKTDKSAKYTKIMVGGKPFADNRNLWKSIGADGCATSFQEAKKIADSWYNS